ncbi:MAG: aspartate aminotransferase family protein [Rhizomicrobium sp.]
MFPSVLPTYNRADVAFVRGEGPYLYAEDGKRYLDFGAGIAVNAFGHAHPRLVAALTVQAGKLWHTSNLYRVPGQESLSKTLVENTFADTAFFTNSGAEACECAFKMARRYHFVSGHPERFRIITFTGAFHGRTLAGIAAGGQEKYLEGFGPKVEGFDQVPPNDLKALEAAITHETAALMIEPIQGEGGLHPMPPEFLRALRKLCDERGLLLIFDEIQCGVGRTGKFFAYEWIGVRPDIMCVAKGIGGGFPLGACLATAEAGQGHDGRQPRLDLWRQSARHGGRLGSHRHGAGARIPGACAEDRRLYAPAARRPDRAASRRVRGIARPGPDAGPEAARAQHRIRHPPRASTACSSSAPARTSCASCRR